MDNSTIILYHSMSRKASAGWMDAALRTGQTVAKIVNKYAPKTINEI
jgi:hypothetical protein